MQRAPHGSRAGWHISNVGMGRGNSPDRPPGGARAAGVSAQEAFCE